MKILTFNEFSECIYRYAFIDNMTNICKCTYAIAHNMNSSNEYKISIETIICLNIPFLRK